MCLSAAVCHSQRATCHTPPLLPSSRNTCRCSARRRAWRWIWRASFEEAYARWKSYRCCDKLSTGQSHIVRKYRVHDCVTWQWMICIRFVCRMMSSAAGRTTTVYLVILSAVKAQTMWWTSAVRSERQVLTTRVRGWVLAEANYCCNFPSNVKCPGCKSELRLFQRSERIETGIVQSNKNKKKKRKKREHDLHGSSDRRIQT